MRIASFDLGIINFACVIAEFDMDAETDLVPIDVQHVFHIDITQYTHNHISREACTLYHTPEPSDRLLHVLQEMEPYFNNMDLFIVERQPIMSTCSHLEEILFQKFRDRIVKVSPNHMHRRFNMSADYEQRKLESVALATPLLEHIQLFQTSERKHDQADALLLACSYVLDQRDKTRTQRLYKHSPNYLQNLNLDQYKFIQ